MIMEEEIGARASPTYEPARGSARRVCLCWKSSDDVIDRCGEADTQFVIKLLKTIHYELNVLIEVASRLLFRFAKKDEADWVTFPLRLVFPAEVFPQRAYVADL
jgi:hypothetical protein